MAAETPPNHSNIQWIVESLSEFQGLGKEHRLYDFINIPFELSDEHAECCFECVLKSQMFLWWKFLCSIRALILNPRNDAIFYTDLVPNL